jgi:hypothetical protein
VCINGKVYRLVELEGEHGLVESGYFSSLGASNIERVSDIGPFSGVVSKIASGETITRKIDPLAIDSMVDRAAEVLGTRDEAMCWLGTPVRGLDFATPISLLGTKEGVERVSDIRGQMEHGVW